MYQEPSPPSGEVAAVVESVDGVTASAFVSSSEAAVGAVVVVVSTVK